MQWLRPAASRYEGGGCEQPGCGPPAPGAHPSEVCPARAETGRCRAGATLAEVACSEQVAVDYRQRSALDGRLR
eukprot:1725639-Alexandrium_andersonii.AAC.1